MNFNLFGFNEFSMLLKHDIQMLADDGNGGGEPAPPAPPAQQQELFPNYGMTEFTEFLTTNASAKTFFEAKMNAAMVERESAIKTAALEEAKQQLSLEGQKKPWEIEIDKLKAETAKAQKAAAQEAIKSQLATKLATPEFANVDQTALMQLVLRDTAEESLATFDMINTIIDTVAEQRKNAEVEKRLNGMTYNPMGGGRQVGGAQESQGVAIARAIAQSKTEQNKSSDRATAHYFAR